MYKRGDCWLTRYTKKECDEAREGFKRCVHQYLIDNDIDDDFDKDIIVIAFNTSILTTVPISSNFFYNHYSVKHFMTLNGLIPIKTAKNIIMSINNDAFAYGLTGGIEPSSMEPSTVRNSNVDIGNESSNNKGKSITYFYDDNDNNNPPDLTVNIDFFNCYFNDNG